MPEVLSGVNGCFIADVAVSVEYGLEKPQIETATFIRCTALVDSPLRKQFLSLFSLLNFTYNALKLDD